MNHIITISKQKNLYFFLDISISCLIMLTVCIILAWIQTLENFVVA